ncbi:MAG: AAA family ATPase [bacterium]
MIGHQKILDFFDKSIENDRLSHAYLFCGPTGIGKRTMALEIIKRVNGCDDNHPDVSIISSNITENEKTKRESEIGIDQVKQIQHQMSLSSYSAPYKVALINKAEKMTTEASNCLLKTLEEPTGKSILILNTGNKDALLPTIVSRCQMVKFMPVADVEIKSAFKNEFANFENDKIDQIIQLANGCPGIVFNHLNNPHLIKEYEQSIIDLRKLIKSDLNERYKFAEEIVKNITQTYQVLNWWTIWLRVKLINKINCNLSDGDINYSLPDFRRIIIAIRKTKDILGNSSFNARLALEVLMLEL